MEDIKSSRSENILNKMKSTEHQEPRDIAGITWPARRNCFKNTANISFIPNDIYFEKYIKAFKINFKHERKQQIKISSSI